VITANATLQGFDANLARAGSRSRRRTRRATSFRVIVTLIMPGIASGMVFAFASYSDEVVVAPMLAGADQQSLPAENVRRQGSLPRSPPLRRR